MEYVEPEANITKSYDYKNKLMKCEGMEAGGIGLIDSCQHEIPLGLEPEIFLDIIQDLINRNMYEYYKIKRESK